MPNPMIHAAEKYRKAGFGIVWLAAGDKSPRGERAKGWTKQSMQPTDYQDGDNLGIMAGSVSGNLVCVDLDSMFAVLCANAMLPKTPMIDGRKSKPMSHRWYRVSDIPPECRSDLPLAGPKIRHYGAAKIDVLGTGAQAVAPPSLHPSGERRCWSSFWKGGSLKPAMVDCETLYDAVKRLARYCGLSDARPCDFFCIHSIGPKADLVRRAAAYLEKIPGAVEGSGGSAHTMYVARVLVWGFCLDHQAALDLMLWNFNTRCSPPWKPRDLQHKIADASKENFSKQRGWLLGGH